MLRRFTFLVLVICHFFQSIRSDETIQILRENDVHNSSTMRTPSLLLSEKELLEGVENALSMDQVEPPNVSDEKYTSESPQDTSSNIEAEETVTRSLSETLDGQLVSIKTNNNSGVVNNALLMQSDQILLQSSESNKRVGDIGKEISSNFKIQKSIPSDINSELESHSQFPALPSNLELSEDSDAGIQYIYSYHPDVKGKLKNSKQVDKKRAFESYSGYNNADKEGEVEASQVINSGTRAHSNSPLDSLKNPEETQKVTIVKQKSIHSISREEKQESVNIQKNPEPRFSNDEDFAITNHQSIQSDTSLHPDVNQNEGSIVLFEESYVPDKNYDQEDGTFEFQSSYDDQPHSQNVKQFTKPGETSNSVNGIKYNNHGDGISTQYFLTKHNSGLTNPLSDTGTSTGSEGIGSKYIPQTQSHLSDEVINFPAELNDPSSDDHLLQKNQHPTDNEHRIIHQQNGDNVVLVHKVDPNQIYIDEKTGQLIKFVTEEESENHFEGSSEGTEADILNQSHELLLKNVGEKNNPGYDSHNHHNQLKGGASFGQNNGYEKQVKGGGNNQFHVGTVSGNSNVVGHLHTEDHETIKHQENGNSDSDNAADYVVLCNGKGNVDYDQSHDQNDYGQKLQTLHNHKGSVQGHNFKGSNSGILQQHGNNKGTHFQMANGGLNYPINSNFEHGNFGSKLGNSNFKGENQVLISLDTDKPFKNNKLEFKSGKGSNNGQYTFVKGISDLDSQLLSGLNKGTHFTNSGMHKQNNVHIEFSKPQNNFKGSISNLNSVHGQSKGPVIGKFKNHKNFKALVGNQHGIKGTFPVINGGNGNGFSKGDSSYLHNTQGNFKGTTIIHGGPNLNSAQGHFKGNLFEKGGNNIYNPGQNIYNSLQLNSMSSLGAFHGQSVGHKLNGNQFQNNNGDLQLGLHPSFGGMMKNQYPPSFGGIVSNQHQPSFDGIVINQHQHSFDGEMKNQYQPSFGGMITNHQSQPHVEWILVEVDGNNLKNTGSIVDNNYYTQYDNQPKLSIPQPYMSYMSSIGGHSYSGNRGISNTYRKPKIRYTVEGRTFPTQTLSTSGFHKGRSALPHLNSRTPKGNINFRMELHKRTGPVKLPQFFIDKRSDVKSDEV